MVEFASPPPLPQEDNIDKHAAPANHQTDCHHASRPSPPPPRRVNHTYRDFSRFEPTWVNKNRKSYSNFPAKLHMIMSNPEFSHVISWMPHGRAWKILNKDLLMSEVIPQYFGQTKYESFTRQLGGWGFKRLHQSGPDFRAYYHECFLRGLPRLTQLMKRVPANLGRLIPHVEGEPNFYEMSKFHPLPHEELPLRSTHCGSGSPPTYSQPRDVMPPHQDNLSDSRYGPPLPPHTHSNYGDRYGPPSPPHFNYRYGYEASIFLQPASTPLPSESCGNSYCLSSHPSHATSYAAPHDGRNNYYCHAPSPYTSHHEHSGYCGSTSCYCSQPPPPQQQHFDDEHPSRLNQLAAPDQFSLSMDMTDPYSSS